MGCKLAICEKENVNPSMTHEDLAQWAIAEFGLEGLDRSTVGRILKQRERFQNVSEREEGRKKALALRWPPWTTGSLRQ